MTAALFTSTPRHYGGLSMSDLTVAIPLRTASPDSLLSQLERALRLNPNEVLISINDPSCVDLSSYLPKEVLVSLDVKVVVTVQPKNLGLYGNFRWLLYKASSRYFMWLAEDDEPTLDVDRLCQILHQKPDCQLAVPTQQLWEYSEEFGHFRFLGDLPIPEGSGKSNSWSLTMGALPEPSWIFGVWRREYLAAIFPRSDFDWLDSLLLIQTLTQGAVVHVQTSPARIGAVINKRPHTVGDKFSGRGFIRESIRSVIARRPKVGGMIQAVRSSASVVLLAWSMNRRYH